MQPTEQQVPAVQGQGTCATLQGVYKAAGGICALDRAREEMANTVGQDRCHVCQHTRDRVSGGETPRDSAGVTAVPDQENLILPLDAHGKGRWEPKTCSLDLCYE